MYECYEVFGDMDYGFGYGYTDCIRRWVYPNGDRFKVRPSCPRFPRSLHLFHSNSRVCSGSEYAPLRHRDVCAVHGRRRTRSRVPAFYCFMFVILLLQTGI